MLLITLAHRAVGIGDDYDFEVLVCTNESIGYLHYGNGANIVGFLKMAKVMMAYLKNAFTCLRFQKKCVSLHLQTKA